MIFLQIKPKDPEPQFIISALFSQVCCKRLSRAQVEQVRLKLCDILLTLSITYFNYRYVIFHIFPKRWQPLFDNFTVSLREGPPTGLMASDDIDCECCAQGTFRCFELCSTCLKEGLGRSKPTTNPQNKHINTLCGFLLYPSLTEPSSIE